MPSAGRASSGSRESLAAVVDRGREALAAAGAAPDAARRDAARLARHVMGWTAAEWAARMRDLAPSEFNQPFFSLIDRRAAHEPIAYLTGEREFFGRPFLVTRDVLIPRPETELIIEEALERSSGAEPPRSIIDIGTGSGCLAATLAAEWPAVRVFATDISPAALEVARRNARRLGVAERVECVEGPLLAGLSGPFDLMVSNPPYVAERDRPGLPLEVVEYEPALALFGGADGLDVIRALLPAAAAALAPGGWLVLEIGLGQADAVRALIEETPGLEVHTVRADLQGIPRVVSARGTA
jgi:release factor glutamine methyltransferase